MNYIKSFFQSFFRHVRFERSRIDHRWDGWEDWEKSLEDEHPGTRESCPECKKSGKMHSFYNVLTLRGEIVGSLFFSTAAILAIVYVVKYVK